MNAFVSSLSALTSGLLRISGQASLLIVLVLVVQWFGRNQLSPRVRYALWLLVVARLVLPVSLESAFSIFNFTTAASANVFRVGAAASKNPATQVEVKNTPAPAASASPAPASISPDPGSAGVSPASSKEAGGTPALRAPVPSAQGARAGSETGFRSPFPWVATLTFVWLTGVVFLLVRIIWIPRRLNARLARDESPTSPEVFAVLDEAKRLSGVNQVLPIVQSRAVESPALLGFIRPWLLLPEGLIDRFSAQELRLVFLHELAHLKRRDIAVNWLTTLLQILHWPNPLVWLAFARMRADRELACDELALSFASAEENTTYGHAIVKLLEGYARPAALPGIVGILEDQTQMQRRITMIAQFKKMTGWSATAAGLVLGLGFVTLTDAQTEKGNVGSGAVRVRDQKITIITSGTEEYDSGVLSPDESAIAYFGRWDARGTNIEVRELKPGQSRKITNGAGGASYDADEPVWSPDSKLLAYWWWQNGSGMSLRISSREGGEARSIQLKWDSTQPGWRTDNPSFTPLDWSRDGKMLVGQWTLADRSRVLATVNIATGEVTGLDAGTVGAQHARFSPSGKLIAYDRTVGGNRDVYLTVADGKRTVRLTDSPADDGTPVFSPDGRYIFFSSNQRGTWDLWGVAVENGEAAAARFLAKIDFGDNPKRVTASGKITFTARGGGKETYALDPLSSTLTVIAKGAFGHNRHATWSPDGTKIAYDRTVGGDRPWLLCVQSSEDGRETLFETGMGISDWLFWSPDSSALAIGGQHASRKTGLYLFSLATRERVEKPILFDVDRNWPLGFSPDGTEFMFMAHRKQRIAVNLKTGAERIVSPPEELTRLAAEPTLANECGLSRDGKLIAYVTKSGDELRLMLASSDYRTNREIARAPKGAGIRSPSVSPDGTQVAYFVRTSVDGPHQLHVAGVGGSSGRLLHEGNFWHVKIGPRWSPDGSKIAVTLASKAVAEIGVLENFLPIEKVATK